MSVSQYQTSVYEVYFGHDLPYLIIASDPQEALKIAKSQELGETNEIYTSVEELHRFNKSMQHTFTNAEIWAVMLNNLPLGALNPKAVCRYSDSNWMIANT